MMTSIFTTIGSGVVTYYLRESGVIPYLESLGFHIVGYGCMTCIGNSGPLDEAVSEAVKKGEIVACGVLSGKCIPDENENDIGSNRSLCERRHYTPMSFPMVVLLVRTYLGIKGNYSWRPLGTSATCGDL